MAASLDVPLAAGTYRISSGYRTPDRPDHRGIDFAAPLKTPIYAAADGIVADSRGALAAGQPGWVNGFGGWAVVDHVIGGKKISTVYGHLYPADLLVAKGQKVTRGQLISRVGNNGESTGPHCHFEVWDGGRLTGGHDVDPAPYFTDPEALTVAQYDDIMKAIAALRAEVDGMHADMRWLLIGGNPAGKNNFHWIADQINALADKVTAQQAK